MKAYLTYFKLKFITGLQYRSAALAGIATQFFFGFIYIMVYVAFYEAEGKDLPMSLSQVTTYLWLNQAFLALVCQFIKDGEIFKIIREGGISYELIRPKDLYFMWFFKLIGQRVANVLLRFIPLILVTSFLPFPYHFNGPMSLSYFLLFLVSLAIGSLLVTALSILYPIFTLITMNEKGVVNILITVSDILSGITVPIAFFPKILKAISSCLPFQYVSDLPFQIYVGSISFQDSLRGIILQIIWLFAMIVLGKILLNKISKRVVVQGG